MCGSVFSFFSLFLQFLFQSRDVFIFKMLNGVIPCHPFFIICELNMIINHYLCVVFTTNINFIFVIVMDSQRKYLTIRKTITATFLNGIKYIGDIILFLLFFLLKEGGIGHHLRTFLLRYFYISHKSTLRAMPGNLHNSY